MNKIVLSGIVLAAGLAASAQGQVQHTFEMRLIADGTAGAPSGLGTAYSIGNPAAVTASRIGFWLQARVMQTGGGDNWGITRASLPAGGGTSFITLNDPAAGSSLSRGTISSSNTTFGRGNGYRSGGTATGQTGNAAGSAAFPSGTNNNNGGLDNGGSGALMTRIYGFDAYVGATRNAVDPDNIYNPWGVNGASNNTGAAIDPVAQGTFSPWANLYRVWVDIASFSGRTVVINASALLNGSMQTSDVGGGLFPMQLSPGQTLSTSTTFTVVPTPGAAAMLGLGGLAALRRRR